IGKSNLRLSLILKSKEPTLQVALDALKITPFYNAFEISADVLEIYMQELWVTVSRHHSSLRFKLNGKSHTVSIDNFRDMLKIDPKLPGQIFKEPPLEEEILSFIRGLGHTGEIKFLSDVNVNHMHQPWRSFAAIINKCLSGKTTALEILRLSCAQIIWGMYHNKTVDYLYLLWEDLVYQVKNKNSKKNNDMYYPRFTKVIVDYFMAKDQVIPRRNKMFWHYARDDFMFTTIRVISKHQDTQVYGAILLQHLTNQAMLESEAYMTYHAYATGEKTPKPKSIKKKAHFESSPKTKLTQASKGKRIKTIAKGDKPAKKNQSVTKSKGLTVPSEVALTKAKQIKLATKRSLMQTHSSHASGSGADKGTGSIPGVPDVPTYKSNDDQISWKLRKSSDEDDDDEVNESEDDDDQNDDNVDNEDDDNQNDDNADNEDDDDQNDDNADNEDDDDDQNDDNANNKEEEWYDDEAYDEETQGVNVEGEELDEEETNEEEEANELYRDVNVNLEERDTEMTDALLANVQNTKVIEDTHVIITDVTPEVQQQSSSVSSGFISKHAQTLIRKENSQKFKQTNQFAAAVSSVPGIVDTYLANKMNEAVKTIVQIQSDRLRDEAQAENEDFINTLDENMRKIIKKQVKEQTSHAVAANLSEHELKNILIDKMENNKLIDRSIQQKTLYKALVDTYETDKEILETYGDTVTFKRRFTEDQPVDETTHHHDWFQKPTKPPTPDRGWNKTLPVKHGSVQTWISTLAQNEDPCDSFNEVMDTPLDFSAFVMNRLKVDTLILELLAGPTYELMKDSCKSLVELEYFLEEVYKATTDQLDWNNPEGQQYLHDLRKLLPLIPNSRGRRESTHDVYSKNKILAVTKLKIVEWHNYKHLDWITVCRNDDKLYTFKEGDYNRLRLQDIEDMLLLLVQGKLTNLNVEECLALGVSLQMFTRSVVLRRRVEDLQLEHAGFDESDTFVLERFDTSAGNPIKEILLKLNLPDHMSILTDSKMEVKVFKITFSHSSQDKGTSSSLKLMITASNHKLMIEVKDYELKTKDKAYYARLADKQSGRPSGSLPSNTQPNLRGGNSKAYQPPQARNKHVNVVFTGSGKSYNPPDKPDESNDINSEKPYQLLDCEMKTMN
ncbi:hypothetical protein Tco_0449014, partial [Tanacetum coccineum]